MSRMPMTLWRLEAERLLRTRRWIALGVFPAFGIIGPLTAKYLEKLLSLAGTEAAGS